MSAMPIDRTNFLENGRVPDPERPAIDPGVSAPNQLGSAVRIQGEIFGEQDMYVDGEVAGSMTLPEHTLTIGAKGRVKANIKARKLVLVGTVEGNIEAGERIELRGSCHVMGDVRSPRIKIENGAYIKGTIEVIRTQQAHAAAKA